VDRSFVSAASFAAPTVPAGHSLAPAASSAAPTFLAGYLFVSTASSAAPVIPDGHPFVSAAFLFRFLPLHLVFLLFYPSRIFLSPPFRFVHLRFLGFLNL
jgi:hypothetical protein